MTGQWGRGPLGRQGRVPERAAGGRGGILNLDLDTETSHAEAGGGHPGLGAVRGEQRSRRDMGREARPVRQGLQGHSKSSSLSHHALGGHWGSEQASGGTWCGCSAAILPAALCQSLWL